jgi:hypothetical protein
VGVFAAVDVHYLAAGGAWAALVLAEDANFATVRHSTTALVKEAAPPYKRRVLPARTACPARRLDDVKDIELLVAAERGRVEVSQVAQAHVEDGAAVTARWAFHFVPGRPAPPAADPQPQRRDI